MNNMVIRTTISFDEWVYKEILEGAKNKSALIQEALIKLHYEKQNSNKEAEKPLHNGPMV